MKNILNRLIQHETLSREDARRILIEMAGGSFNSGQMAAFMTVYMMRSIQLEELQGFRDALLELCTSVDLSEYEAIDLCGTGGDGKDTFNISTLSSFVVAGAGVHVSKHGNYGVSSRCGSSNVLEQLGIVFSASEDFLKKCMDQAGICILHAPLFHPAMKQVAPVRRELGVKTFFNMLGPMVNPSYPKSQMVGVFNLELARMYGYLYQNTGQEFCILHALDGYDEISLTGTTKAISRRGETMLEPEDFGLKELYPDQISGGQGVEDSARIFMDVLEGRGSDAQIDVVCANAGMAIATARGTEPAIGCLIARESLVSGAALRTFRTLQELSQKEG